MIIIMNLIAQTKNSTVSSVHYSLNEFTVDEETHFLGFMIEDGYRKDKVWGETRIYGGIYDVNKIQHGRFYEKYKRQFNHKFAIEIVHTTEIHPKFKHLRIHTGNTVRETNGCPLINTGVIMSNGNWVGRGSRDAYLKLYDLVDKAHKTTLIVNRTQDFIS